VHFELESRGSNYSLPELIGELLYG